MRVAMLGLGLIGGSIVRALRDRTPGDGSWSVAAWSPSGDGPSRALAEGTIDAATATAEAAVDGADLVVLAGPAPVCLAQLDDLSGPWRTALADGAVITDVASTKEAIVLRATALGLRFVGGHPMAGRESSGYAASVADLFVDRPWVVVPGTDVAATDRVESLAHAVGARPVRMTAADHDRAVAGISHLPLVVAAALVEAVAGRPGDERPDWPAAARLAASGWRDMTRLARGDVEMGAGILATNGAATAARVRDLIAVLEAWAAALDRDGERDGRDVAARLRAARERIEEPGR